MEAATPLRPRRVHALVGRLIVENVVVDDPVAAELVSRAIEAGEDPARVVADMIEIGARVLAHLPYPPHLPSARRHRSSSITSRSAVPKRAISAAVL